MLPLFLFKEEVKVKKVDKKDFEDNIFKLMKN